MTLSVFTEQLESDTIPTVFLSSLLVVAILFGMLIFTLATMPKFIHIQMPVDISDPAAVNEKTSL
ncbi:hypothetical protein A7B51_09580 [Lentilactobacillus parabuchneri]|jgi:methyl coenzyme M reductase subunit C|uniref:Uncharacterized protein n=1 Tax=Lentilactobacillus parabuchneri DSM 5707 = NBRC 107865 TaxID=1423784 RepID=A0A0R1YVI5_9LACO|nr:hypothetical protein [Lentilactobacillus parabuchneri]KRM46353.1 hypothetical protein FC51_GL002182 [Lentilactobacillus parabuchneri DSM 5707 = NBRC 107865]KRN79747.1 hypothetical protein IV42_GL001084 [Lentilactobacillus parabuchneri]MCT2885250.1 hypothetical protein [Lentilactobacillus parabuchneri]OBU96416.1 hypothetical protein A7B51_09580 [Lentilactobacillus parabuchneri]OCB79034.1 hypothetical protein A7322_08810 [Lentilactobacillus parabuchneri]